MTIEIVVTLDLDPALARRIEGAAPSLRVRTLAAGTRATFGRRLPYPSELQSAVPDAELVAALTDAEVILAAWAGMIPSLDLTQVAPHLRWVQLTQAGAEHIDPARAAGITFTTIGDMSAGPIAEWVLTAILMFAKGWPQTFRDQQAHNYRRYMPRELATCTIGIIGLGAIGTEVARRLKPFGCRILGIRRSFTVRGPHPLVDEAMPPADLDYLLGASDFVVLAAPATAETRHLIDARALAAMRPDGVLINVARGSLIDDAALVEALQAQTIAGAALDVFTREPLAADSPLWDLDNIVLSPHVAAGTDRYYDRTVEVFCENLTRYLRGEPLSFMVDTTRGY